MLYRCSGKKGQAQLGLSAGEQMETLCKGTMISPNSTKLFSQCQSWAPPQMGQELGIP